MFENSNIDFKILRQRAFNLRWASVEEGVIPLTAADPDFQCCEKISASISDYSQSRYFCYGDPEGKVEFKNAISNFHDTKRGVRYHSSNILPVESAAYGIYLTCKTILSIGDQAIIFNPVDFLFKHSIEAVGGQAVAFPIHPGHAEVDFDKLESLINVRTKLICLCNPLNPTGKVFSYNELKKLGEIADRYNLFILSDEIWSDIVFEPVKYTSIASINEEIKNRTIIVTGYSKSYGLAGLRVGAVLCPTIEIFKSILNNSLHNSTIHGVSVLSQIAATTALNDCQEWLNNFVIHLTKMRDFSVEKINSIPGLSCISPEGCYVLFINISQTGFTSDEIYQLLLNKGKVAVVPGLSQWFGDQAEGYIRISFATSEKVLSEAFDRIKNTLN